MMKAIGIEAHADQTGVDALVDLELPGPGAPEGHDLLVRVKAVSVNPVDTKVRRGGNAEQGQPRILGYDAAGVVEAVGPAAKGFNLGDEVFYAGDMTRAGSNAELQLVDGRIVGPKPRQLDFAEAAAFPLVALTAWEALFERFGIDREGAHAGRTLLIIAGAGGVGSIAIQLAKLAGLTVIATASRDETVAWAKELGADAVVNHHQPIGPQLEGLGHEGVDYIANFHDTNAYWDTMAEVIRPQGKILSIVGTTGPVDLGVLMLKSVSFHWELMFTRSMHQTADLAQQGAILREVAALIDAGQLRPIDRQTLSPINAAQLRAAHEQLESASTIGKLVLAGWAT